MSGHFGTLCIKGLRKYLEVWGGKNIIFSNIFADHRSNLIWCFFCLRDYLRKNFVAGIWFRSSGIFQTVKWNIASVFLEDIIQFTRSILEVNSKSKMWKICLNLSPIRPIFFLYTSWKRQKNRFSDCFRVYEKGTLALNGSTVNTHPVHYYMFKTNNRNTGARCEICSKLTIKTPTSMTSFCCLYC